MNGKDSPLYRPGTTRLGDALTDAHAALIPSHEAGYELSEAA